MGSGFAPRYELTLNAILRYVKRVFGDVEVVYRPPHGNNIRSTYGREYERILRLADGLRRLGVGTGDRVATMDWNTIWHFELYWAVPGMGAVLHPVNVLLSAENIVYVMNHAQDKVLIYNRYFAPLVERIRPHLKTVKTYIQIADGEGAATPDPEIEDVVAQGSPTPLPELKEEQVATIGYTSGTTGRPKGAYFTHRALVLHTLSTALANSAYRGFMGSSQLSKWAESTPNTWLQLVPMFHVHGWGTTWSMALRGWRQVYPGRFDPGHVLRVIVEEKVNATSGVPTILYMLLTHPDFPNYAPKIRELGTFFTGGGSALPEALAKRAAEAGFTPGGGYGMTETAPVVAANFLRPTEKLPDDPEQLFDMLTSTGFPIPLVDLEVVDEEGRPVPHDGKTVGEIVLRSPWVTPEYMGEPERTAEAWRGGWFHTGDVAVVRPDGRIRFVDRVKDVVKSGGEWISSFDLENLIASHPAVGLVAVVGLPHEKWGERPVAFVVPRAGAKITEADILAHLQRYVEAGRIPKWWLPDRVVFVDQLPLTSVGKADKKVLREQYRDLLK